MGANLSGADLHEANLNGVNFVEAILYEAKLGGAELSGANFWQANLMRANLRGARLVGANLWGAILHETDPELAFDVPAFLPDDYVEDTGQRLDLYRRLSLAPDIDAVAGVMEEIRDRFGEPPEEVRNLGYIMGCKTYGRRLHATALEKKGARLSLRLREDTPLPADVAVRLHKLSDGQMRMAGPDRIIALLPDTQRLQVQLEAAQAALASLVTHL